MEIKISAGDIIRERAGAVILPVFAEAPVLEGELAVVDRMVGGAISQMVEEREVKGRPNEVTLIHSLGRLPAEHIVLVGLGKAEELTLDKIRSAVAVACRYLRQRWVTSVAVPPLGAGVADITAESSAQAITEGTLLGTYSFRHHMTREVEYGDIEELTLVATSQNDMAPVTSGYQKGKIIARAANLARDMVNEPSNYKTPTYMAEKAADLARTYGLKLTVLEKEEMQKLGMGGLLGVAQGSDQPPKFIVLEYRSRNSSEIDIALVGKGITFDSGGISIKPSENMGEMKGDMAGGRR